MNTTTIVKHYSNSFLNALELSSEKDNDVYDEISVIIKLFSNNKDLDVFFSNPSISVSQKLLLASKLFSNSIPLLYTFIAIVIKNKRSSYLYKVLVDTFSVLHQKQGNMTINIITAFELSDIFIEKIKFLLSKKFDSTIDINNTVDQSILGGIIITWDYKMLDLSVNSALNLLELLSKNVLIKLK